MSCFIPMTSSTSFFTLTNRITTHVMALGFCLVDFCIYFVFFQPLCMFSRHCDVLLAPDWMLLSRPLRLPGVFEPWLSPFVWLCPLCSLLHYFALLCIMRFVFGLFPRLTAFGSSTAPDSWRHYHSEATSLNCSALNIISSYFSRTSGSLVSSMMQKASRLAVVSWPKMTENNLQMEQMWINDTQWSYICLYL